MKNFNINEYMYIQITEEGWEHLEKTVGIDYINTCIKTPNYTKIINGETWYRLQCWSCFDLMPPDFGGRVLFNTNVMFDDEALENSALPIPDVSGRSEQLKADLYAFRDMWCQNIDIATIDEYVDSLGF